MSAEQQNLYLPRVESESTSPFPNEVLETFGIAFLSMFSADERLRKKASKIELPKVVQTEGTQPFGFYTDLQEYHHDLVTYGAKEARVRLHARLYSSLATMDQEARRSLTTHPIPMHFSRTKNSNHFSWRAIGRNGDWKRELLQRNDEKPDGLEKERFTLEINLMIKAFDDLLSPLEAIPTRSWDLLSEEKKTDFLQSQLGYVRRSLQVTRHMTLLFPKLADQYGKSIECVISPNALHVYTPSEFHLGSASSFFYIKNIAYVPSLGFIGLDQGLMSGYLEEDQREILNSITEFNVDDWGVQKLMTTVLTLRPELASLPAPEVFEAIKKIIPFKSLEMTEHVNPDSCGEKEYRNYIRVIQAIFDKEMKFLSAHPEFAESSQERNEVFSRYIAFALGLKDKLPKRKMLTKYQSILDDKDMALHPKENIKKIDTSVATIYGNLASIPLRLERMIECSVIGGIQTGLGRFNPSNLQSVLGERLSLSENISMDLRNGITSLRDNDDISFEKAREFAKLYNINPNWIGDVIKYYPNGAYCKAGDHTAHWVGQCGDHTMCLACNMQYNLDHGIVDLDQLSSTNESPAWLQQLYSYISVSKVDVSDFITGLFTKKDVYKDKIQQVALNT